MSHKEREFMLDLVIAFTEFCDRNGLTVEQGIALADAIGAELEFTADERRR